MCSHVKIKAKRGVGVNIYLWKLTDAADRSYLTCKRYNRLFYSVCRSSSPRERSRRRSVHRKIYAQQLLIFFFFFCDLIPNFFLLSLLSLPHLFFSFLCIFTARLFGSCSFGLGRVALSRQCCKMNFLNAKKVRFFWTLEASSVLPIHASLMEFIPHIVCVLVYSNALNV